MKQSRVRILVADDEQGFRDLMAFALEPFGFEVTTVCDGQEALAIFRDRPFELVILDVHMPKITGLEALAEIMLLRPQQRVILFSGRPDALPASELKASGAAACLYKPVDLDDLIACVHQILEIDESEVHDETPEPLARVGSGVPS